MLFNKPLAEVEESDLQMLLDNNIREGREVEYKGVLTIHTDEQKLEFLYDVSSFANASGGYLFYGIKESKEDAGKPIEVCGLKGENPGKKIVDMENIIRTGLEPRLHGVAIFPVSLPSHEGHIAIALHILKSYASPHMVKSSGRFFSRNSVGKFPLDVAQLRTAFELAGTTAERIRSFRVERLSRISSGEETPAPLGEQEPKLVLHMVPFNAFSAPESLDLRSLNDAMNGQLWKPLLAWDLEPNVDVRFNIDGIVRLNNRGNPPSTVAYTQVFRNGIIETVDMSLLGVYMWSTGIKGNIADTKSLNGETYERKLLETVKRFIKVQRLLGIEPPFFIMVSLLGVKGHRIVHPMFENNFTPFTEAIDRANLVIPEIIIENFDTDLARAMKPIFDTVWNAAGREGSLNYDEAGKFKFGY
jgi:Putative DNA-binding domain